MSVTMLIVIMIILAIVMGAIGAVLATICFVSGIKEIKKKARNILKAGKIENEHEYRDIMEHLSHIQNDLEAADLWKRLRELET